MLHLGYCLKRCVLNTGRRHGSIECDVFFCSLNPLIDIGQIEGGFVMGLGYHLMEDIIYDVSTGRVLNDGTWVHVHSSSSVE